MCGDEAGSRTRECAVVHFTGTVFGSDCSVSVAGAADDGTDAAAEVAMRNVFASGVGEADAVDAAGRKAFSVSLTGCPASNIASVRYAKRTSTLTGNRILSNIASGGSSSVGVALYTGTDSSPIAFDGSGQYSVSYTTGSDGTTHTWTHYAAIVSTGTGTPEATDVRADMQIEVAYK